MSRLSSGQESEGFLEYVVRYLGFEGPLVFEEPVYLVDRLCHLGRPYHLYLEDHLCHLGRPCRLYLEDHLCHLGRPCRLYLGDHLYHLGRPCQLDLLDHVHHLFLGGLVLLFHPCHHVGLVHHVDLLGLQDRFRRGHLWHLALHLYPFLQVHLVALVYQDLLFHLVYQDLLFHLVYPVDLLGLLDHVHLVALVYQDLLFHLVYQDLLFHLVYPVDLLGLLDHVHQLGRVCRLVHQRHVFVYRLVVCFAKHSQLRLVPLGMLIVFSYHYHLNYHYY
ncbi:Uncharacterised protein [Streptococcus pyogenes]|nr:Uncharacterised protein [Streptococcus pyogenes]